MRGANILVIMLVVGILLFGCTSPTPPAKPNGTGTAAPEETGGTSGSTGSTGSTGATGSETGASGSTGSETGTSGTETGSTGSAVDDLAGKGYEALAAMGVPLQCDITTTSSGKTVNAHVYMKGSQEVRSEVAVPESETCTQMVSIMKGKTVYIGCTDGSIMQDCQWLQMEVNDTGTTTAGTASTSPDYEDVPPANINCAPWVYDASKFAVSGKVCNLNDLMKGYGDYQIPEDN